MSTLIGNMYVQPSSNDPGSVGFGYMWSQSDTGLLYIRNTSNSAWTFVGNTGLTSLGDVSIQPGPQYPWTSGLITAAQIGSVLTPTFTVTPYTATANQTLFSGVPTYTPGASTLSVYQNGARLVLTLDYLETSSTSFTLINGAQAGDTVVATTGQNLNGVTPAANISYLLPAVGAVAETVQTKLQQTVSVLDFGADPTGATDSTAAIQKAINAASNANTVELHFPAGIYNYTNLYCYYDATLNPGYNATRNSKMVLTGEGIAQETTGNSGTILVCTATTGDGFIASPVVADGGGYSDREFVVQGITFKGNTAGSLLAAYGAVEFRATYCSFLQSNAAGSGLRVSTAYFGIIEKCRFNTTTPSSGNALAFSTTSYAGLFTLRDCNISGYAVGLNFLSGGWQLLSVYDSEIFGNTYAFRLTAGYIQQLNFVGCYFESSSGCASWISDAVTDGIQGLGLNGCWGYGNTLSSAAINLTAPQNVTIANCFWQGMAKTFLNITALPSGGRGSFQVIDNTFYDSPSATSAVTYFTGILPAFMGVEYDYGNANVTLYATTARPIMFQPGFKTTSYIGAGHINETHTLYTGAVAGSTWDLNSSNNPAFTSIYNVTSPTTFYLGAKSLGLLHGYSCTITNLAASTQSSVIATAVADGAATLCTLAPGTQRKFVFFNDGTNLGWM